MACVGDPFSSRGLTHHRKMCRSELATDIFCGVAYTSIAFKFMADQHNSLLVLEDLASGLVAVLGHAARTYCLAARLNLRPTVNGTDSLH